MPQGSQDIISQKSSDERWQSQPQEYLGKLQTYKPKTKTAISYTPYQDNTGMSFTQLRYKQKDKQISSKKKKISKGD